jgi:cytochrome c biogenesis protein
MTQKVETRPLPPASSGTPVTAAPTFMDRVDRALEGLWHFLSSMRVAMVVMLAIAVMGVIGSLVIQAPSAVWADPVSRADWLDGVRPRLGGWTDPLATLDVFNIFNSLVFRGLVAFLTISLIACSIHRTPGMWRTATKPRVDVGPAFFEHAPQHEAIVSRQPAADTTAAATAILRKRGYRVLDADDGTVHLYADKHRWLSFAGLIAHVSIILILAGAIIGGAFGYRDSAFSVAEGSTRDVGAEAGLALKVLDFQDQYDTTTGAPIDYASTVELYKNGQLIDEHVIRVNDPLRYNDVTFYQAGFGSAAAVTIKGEDGAVLLAEGLPYDWSITAEERPLAIWSVPDSDKTLWILGTTGSSDPRIKPGQVEVQVWQHGQDNAPIAQQVVDQGKAADVAGLNVTFDRETQYTRLNVARDPGVTLVWIGALLLFGGFAIRFMFPHKRMWGRITSRPNGGAVLALATLTQKDVASGTEFEHIVTDIRTALRTPANG